MDKIITYDDMTDAQKRIVDSCNGPVQPIPPELKTAAEIHAWLMTLIKR